MVAVAVAPSAMLSKSPSYFFRTLKTSLMLKLWLKISPWLFGTHSCKNFGILRLIILWLVKQPTFQPS